jgi:hypothetical protein
MIDFRLDDLANVLVNLTETPVQGRAALSGAMRHLGGRLVLRTGQDVH